MTQKIPPMALAAVYAFLMPLAVGVLANWKAMPAIFSDSTAAAWVQGVGTVAAVFAAILMPAWQRSQATRDRHLAVVGLAEMTRALLQNAITHAEELCELEASGSVFGAGVFAFNIEQLEKHLKRVRAYPIVELNGNYVFVLDSLELGLTSAIQVLSRPGRLRMTLILKLLRENRENSQQLVRVLLQ